MAFRLDRLLRRLDAVPVAPAAAVGVAAGTAASAGLLWEPTVPRVAAAALLALLAVPLALAARAATEVEQSAKKKPGPPPPRDPRVTLPMDMVEIAGGSFWMGSRDDDPQAYDYEKPQHRVEVGAFAMGRYVVTQAQYREVMGTNPGDESQSAELPVSNVKWFDAVQFCNKLSQREGLGLCYAIDGENVSWNREAEGYRLPTEAEWEYAARGGTDTAWSFGDSERQLGDHAWYAANSDSRVHPVGAKKPNPWGLFDVHGNVWEWCWVWHGAYPEPPSAGVDRVLRGGSWLNDPGNLRSAYRFWFRPVIRLSYVGFRCVRGLPRQHGR